MYTYVIIDDEKLIRLGLISRVKEIDSEQFECVGQAVNGVEGLALIEEVHPDIVITDMKMAKMDGVEFLQRLSEKYPGIPVIVISGYKAFDYMNQAIEQGVVGYVLKPYSTEEIEKQLLKAAAKIEQQRIIAKMQEQVDSMERRTEEKEILKLILEPWQVEKSTQFRNITEQWHILLSICTNKPDILNLLQECAADSLGEAISLCLEDPSDNGQYYILCSGTEEEIVKAGKNLPGFLDRIKRKLIDYKFFAAIGKRFYGLEGLNPSYQKNEKMLRGVYLNKNFQVFAEEEYVYKRKFIYSEEEYKDFMVALKYSHNDKEEILKKFFERFSVDSYCLRDMGHACKVLLSRVDDWAIANQVETDDVMSVFYRRYRCQKDIEKIKMEISGYINLICMSIERKNCGDDYIYENMVKYIQEHYDEKITLQTLADQFYVSSGWCSNIFKEKMKKSLNTYLTDIRIARAKELLDDTQMSVEQISREIGYPNPKYFFRMFKQMTTFTPIEYRNRRK